MIATRMIRAPVAVARLILGLGLVAVVMVGCGSHNLTDDQLAWCTSPSGAGSTLAYAMSNGIPIGYQLVDSDPNFVKACQGAYAGAH